MTADTPTPYQPPDGVILTTMAEARRVGHGEVSTWPARAAWWELEHVDSWGDDSVVWWRPTPERTVTIELPESVARFAMSWGRPLNGPGAILKDVCRDAIARLDGEAP